MRQKITFFGNCQGGALKSLLDSTEVIQKHFEIIAIPVHSASPDKIDEIVDTIKQSNYFIHQPINNYKGIKQFSSDYLQNILFNKVKSISFPSIYFNGYTPYAVHLRKKDGSRFISLQTNSIIHDRNILLAFYEGKTVEQTYQIIAGDSFYSKDSSLTSVNNAIQELKRREEEHNLDIVVSDIISNKYKKNLLFNTVNHPTSKLLKEVAIKIGSKIGINLDDEIIRWPKTLKNYSLYIYPSTYKNLQLQFPHQQYYKYNSYKINVKENIEKTFALYQYNKNDIEYAVAGIKAHDFVIKTFSWDLSKFVEQADREIYPSSNDEFKQRLLTGEISRKQYIQDLYYNCKDKKTFFNVSRLHNIKGVNNISQLPVANYTSKPSLQSQLFTILTYSQADSHYLMKVLNSLQDFECLGAAFNRKTVWIPYKKKEELIKWLKSKHNMSVYIKRKPFEDKQLVRLIHQEPQLLLNFLQETGRTKYIGFKIFPNNLSLSKIQNFIFSNQHIKKIILKRNLLDVYISEKLLQKSKRSSISKDNSSNLAKIYIDNKDFDRWYKKAQHYYNEIEKCSIGYNCQWANLNYEDINSFDNDRAKVNYICNRLGTQGFEIASNINNLKPESNINTLLEQVENYEDFIVFLNKNNFSYLLK